MYHRKHKYDLIIILSIVALCFSLFLAVSEALKITVPCDITGGCEIVLNSKYANFLGFPLSYLGVGFFGIVVFISLLSNHYLKFRKILTVVLGIGAVLAIYFLTVQLFVIKQICQYCFVIDTLSIFIFIWDLNVEHFSLKDL